MKRKSIGMLALAMLLALSLMSAVAFASESTTTTAKIGFMDGDLEFDDSDLGTDMNNMDIDFGDDNVLPSVAETYTATDGSHKLRVKDARSIAGGWTVTVGMTAFINQTTSGNTFDGIITLKSPSTSAPADTTGFSAEPTVTISSAGSGDVPVMTADSTVVHGIFDATWTQSNIVLAIDDAAATATIAGETYEATLTWTLTSP